MFDRIGNLLGNFALAERSLAAMQVVRAVEENLASERVRRAAVRRRMDRAARAMLDQAKAEGLPVWLPRQEG